jgi:hypothetical protein
MFELESQIRKWRAHLRSTGSVGAQDLEELESHLRDSVEEMTARGVTTEEAFLISVRRMGDAEALSQEFAKISTENVWRQLLVPAPSESARRRQRLEVAVVVGLTLLAGLLGKVPALFGYGVVGSYPLLYLKNAALFALPSVAVYLVWKRSLPLPFVLSAVAVFTAFALVINLYPSYSPHHTEGLIAIHLPIVLLLFLGVLYGGSGWRRSSVRLDYVRFAGEVFIYSVLIGLGGVVLISVSVMMFQFVQIDTTGFAGNWLAVFGGCGMLVVASFLVERKKALIESIAPVLARIFAPLFLAVLLSLIVAMAVTGRAPSQDREMLIWFDLVLALVLGLALYTMSARDAEEPVGVWDVVILALLVVALIANGIALSGIVIRLSAYGFSANKTAALGENVFLLANLLLLTIGYARFFAGRMRFQEIVDLQMRYLPAYAAWATLVVVAFPPIFGFI